MANPLTGDFEAVLQVSGATVNRLVAAIHQNGGTKTTLPDFTHGTQLRVGDPNPIDGMRGTIAFQVAAPHIELIHGVSDRFWLEVAVRARYKPDPGTLPIPEFIHGTVRAQYRIDPIDRSCRGWQTLASEYLWIRVIGDTVSFTGTAEDDSNDFVALVEAVDPAVADARITKLARVLLKTRFEATPHKVSRRFRPGSMRSLQIGANRSVVAMPIGLTADPPPGHIDSINQDLLSGRDFGIAISRDFILGRIQQQLDALRASFVTSIGFRHRTYIDLGIFGDVDVVEVRIDWTIKLTAASAEWLGGLVPMFGLNIPGGLVAITLKGEARTEKSIFNWDFNVTQLLLLSFDAPSEQFTVAPFGSATVQVFGTLAGIVEPHAKPQIQSQIAGQVQSAAGELTSALGLKNRKDELIRQLQTIDDQANAWFDEAEFTANGVIVRGHIALSPRRPPAQTFAMTPEQDGYTAFDTWIPGGRIDSFAWSWMWLNNAGEPGSDTRTDRFVLRRPHGGGRGRFGITLGLHRPLPGLDGMGRICLAIRGVQVHPVTGELVPVSTTRRCTRFGLDIRVATGDRIFVREWSPGPRDPIGPVAEAAIHEVNGPHSKGHGANTLVIRAEGERNREVAASLRDGLLSSSRRDAGLVVLVLFPDGAVERAGWAVMAEFDEIAAEVEAPLIVNEDVRGSWSKALGMDYSEAGTGQLEWRLISPTGGVTWAHGGPITARELASALDEYLFRSPVPEVTPILPGLGLGARISSLALDAGLIERLIEVESPCPPPPLGRFGIATSVSFVARHSTASDAALREVVEEHGRHTAEMFRIVIVDGAGAGDIEKLSRALPEGALVIPDPDGTISKRFGIRVWPSTVTLNEVGRVTGFEMGTDSTVLPRSGEGS